MYSCVPLNYACYELLCSVYLPVVVNCALLCLFVVLLVDMTEVCCVFGEVFRYTEFTTTTASPTTTTTTSTTTATRNIIPVMYFSLVNICSINLAAFLSTTHF